MTQTKAWVTGQRECYQPKWGNEKKVGCGVGVAESAVMKEKEKMKSLVLEERHSRCPCNQPLDERGQDAGR